MFICHLPCIFNNNKPIWFGQKMCVFIQIRRRSRLKQICQTTIFIDWVRDFAQSYYDHLSLILFRLQYGNENKFQRNRDGFKIYASCKDQQGI